MTGSRLWRLLGWAMIGVFGLFAALQYNDPDGWLWMGLYGYAGLLGVGALYHWRIRSFAAVGIISYTVLALYWLPSDLTNWIEIEEAREAFGLVICIVWFLALLLMQLRMHPRGYRS